MLYLLIQEETHRNWNGFVDVDAEPLWWHYMCKSTHRTQKVEKNNYEKLYYQIYDYAFTSPSDQGRGRITRLVWDLFIVCKSILFWHG